MLNLIGLDKSELKAEILKIGEKPFRAGQIWDWIYVKNTRNFQECNNIPKNLIEKLENNYQISSPLIVEDLVSKDGTRKWLINFDNNQNQPNSSSKCSKNPSNNGAEIEMVYIPEKNRGTLCVSSQIGCTLTCKFCHTGTQTLVRNLTAGEIIWQFLIAKDLLPKDSLTNIVFMGMGEPLFNYENVKKAIKILNDDKGINFSKRRIVLSTSGVVPELLKFCDEVNSNLAISLHSVRDDVRSQIMPINKKYPLEELIKACKYYNQANSQFITFEYVMLKGINDSDFDAQELVSFIKDNQIKAKVNIIPFNIWQGSIYECSSRNRIMSFARIIEENNIYAPIRKTRGEDVMAACGQLKSLSLRKKLTKIR
jgi:23S rRNA (adenine2503-C2)-methyltransferase